MPPFTDRIALVRSHLDQWQTDALLVTSPVNRRWLTGFTGSFGMVLISADSAVLATDGRYWQVVEQECPAVTLFRYQRTTTGGTQAFLDAFGTPRIALEGGDVTMSRYRELEQAGERTWISLKDELDSLRMVKNAAEIATIRAAAALADATMAQVPHLVRPGLTEKELAWALEKFMRESGADGLAFDIIVASGPNGAHPHHHPSDRPMEPGDAITIDLGARLDGYHSDLTRTFHLGEEPGDRFREVYGAVLSAEESAIAHVRPGITGAALDKIARDIISAAGYGEAFLHSLGHGVGLQIHEAPALSQHSPEIPLPAGAVITIEPGIYLPDWSGVRIEDLVLITENGHELLSHAPKNPLIP
jgi:Xaa-Pro aminopeptidase